MNKKLIFLIYLLVQITFQFEDEFSITLEGQEMQCLREYVFKDNELIISAQKENIKDGDLYQILSVNFNTEKVDNKISINEIKENGEIFQGRYHDNSYQKTFVPQKLQGEHIEICIQNLNFEEGKYRIKFEENISGEQINVKDSLKQNSMAVIEVLTYEIYQLTKTLKENFKQKSAQEIDEFFISGNLNKNIQFFGFLSILIVVFISLLLLVIVQSFLRRKKQI